MNDLPDDPPKKQSLRAAGTLNLRPERVVDPLFRDSVFFDSNDILQVRYEMIRRAEKGTLGAAAGAFGVSVPTCVRLRRRFREGGLQGLIPRARGPKGAYKVTPEILDFIADYRFVHGPVSAVRLVPIIEQHFGVRLHPRSLTKALERSKKNV